MTKQEAIELYENALADPATADWQAVANAMREHFPKSKEARVPGVPKWWRDYDVKGFAALKKAKQDIVQFEFADGRVVRAAALSLPAKGFNIGRAARMAIAFYRLKAGEGAAVPEFVSVDGYSISGCGPISVDTFNTLTEALRAEGGGAQDVARGVEDLDSRIAKVEAELERRKGRRELDAILGELEIRQREANGERYKELRALKRGLTSTELEELRICAGAGYKSVDELRNQMNGLASEFALAIRAGENELAKLLAQRPVVEPEPEPLDFEDDGEPCLDPYDPYGDDEDDAPVVVAPPFQYAAPVLSFTWGTAA